jgi:hypothetical protein
LESSTEVRTYLLVGEPDATVNDGQADRAHAGRAFLFKAPLDSDSAEGNEPNALTSQLVDPTGVEEWAIFGGWIAGGNYLNSQVILGEQFAISARGRTVTFGSTSHEEAGQVYTFYAFVP